MERASFDEEAGTFVLAACALVIVGAGAFRVLRDQSRTTRAVREWLLGTSGVEGGATKPALGAAHGAPALILVGIRRPRVMISDAAASVAQRRRVAGCHPARAWAQTLVGQPEKSVDQRDSISVDEQSGEIVAGSGRAGGRRCGGGESSGGARSGGGADQTFPIAEAVAGTRAGQRAGVRVIFGQAAGGAPAGVARRWTWPAHRTWPWTLVVLVSMTVAIASHYGATLVLTHRLTELLVP